MSRFPTTRWSLIELARLETPAGTREQMGVLLESYRQPMYAHLRYKGIAHERAEDLIQEFLLEILNKDLFGVADPDRGKFRTLLLTALDRFAVTSYRRESAAKRSPKNLASLDAMPAEPMLPSDGPPSDAFERAWALDVLSQSLARMKEECDGEGQTARWAIFEARLVRPLLDDTEAPDYADLAAAHGLPHEKAAMNVLVTAKRQFSRTLRELVKHYVTRCSDCEAHLEQLADKFEDSRGDASKSSETTRHLVQRAIDEAVEEEIGELKKILARPAPPDDAYLAEQFDTPLKSGFLRQLHSAAGNGQVSRMLDGEGGDERSIPPEVHFAALLETPLNSLFPAGSGALRDVLTGRIKSLAALKAVKNWANFQRSARTSSLPADFASAVYYGSVAAAKVSCGERITQLNVEALKAGWNWVAEQDWLDEDVRSIIRRAIAEVSAEANKG